MGFPSPADDYVQTRLQVLERLVRHESATFFMLSNSRAMMRAGIGEGDILVIDRSLTAVHGNLVVAVVEDEYVIRRLAERDGKHVLVAADPRMREIPIDDLDCQIWGVITHAIREYVA